MKRLSLADILQITGGSPEIILHGSRQENSEKVLHQLYADQLSIDSRKCTGHSLFLPFQGEKTDAHRFLPQVLAEVPFTVTEESDDTMLQVMGRKTLPDGCYLHVDSTLAALQKIAKAIRSSYHHPVIGVTGSVGKTTTREMITAALETKYQVFHTEGNQNSQIGVPLTLSSILDRPSDVAVLEMGISEPGGMDRLTDMVNPDMAVVTMIGVAHIEFMKTRERIRDEKMRIISRMGRDGVVFLNGDDPLLRELKGTLPVRTVYFGTDDFSDYRGESFRVKGDRQEFDFCHGTSSVHVVLSQLGKHNAMDLIAALAVADHMGIPAEEAAGKFRSFHGLRQKILHTREGYTVIDDSYNASPVSMKAAADLLNDLDISGRRYAVLGDMFELGKDSAEMHRDVGRHIRLTDPRIDEVLLIGEQAELIGEQLKGADFQVTHFDRNEDAVSYLKNHLKKGDGVLVKASNGMRFSEIVKGISDDAL